MVDLMATGSIRRCLGFGRRDAAADREGRRRPGQLRPDPELRGRLRGPEGPVVQHRRRRRRTASRTAAAPNLMVWNNERSAGGHRQLGADLARLRLQGQALDLRQPDLHRRRCGVPEGDAARSQHHEPVRARRRPVQRRGRPAEAADGRTSASTGTAHVREAGDVVQVGRDRRRHDVAVPGQPAWRPRSRRVPVTAIIPKEGTTGWSDTWMIYSKAAHPNCMYLWMNYIISPGGECQGRGVLRRGAFEREGVRPDARTRTTARRTTQTTRPTGRTSTTGTRLRRTAVTTAVRSARPTRTGEPAWTEIKG